MDIPKGLILFRFLLAPVILALAYFIGENSKIIIVVLMYLGLISDIFDGIIARRQNSSTEKLRRLDSQTDMIFQVRIMHICTEKEWNLKRINISIDNDLRCLYILIHKMKANEIN